MIQFNDVSFGYTKKKPIYSNIQLELTAGSVYGLLGKNGAGKSTLLKLMAGLIYPQKGHLNVFDANPSKRDPSFLNHVFFIPEEIDTPNIDVLEFSAQLMPFYPKIQSRTIFGLSERIRHPLTKMNNMSFGQKKKVWIALGMASNASLIILDEPTNGLDIPSKRILRKLIASVINEDKCIIISTHQIKDIDSLIDKVILVDEGEIIANTDIETITEKLLFEVSNELSQNEAILYHESSLVGHFIVKKRTNETVTTKLDLELFFNACINNKIDIKALFN